MWIILRIHNGKWLDCNIFIKKFDEYNYLACTLKNPTKISLKMEPTETVKECIRTIKRYARTKNPQKRAKLVDTAVWLYQNQNGLHFVPRAIEYSQMNRGPLIYAMGNTYELLAGISLNEPEECDSDSSNSDSDDGYDRQ